MERSPSFQKQSGWGTQSRDGPRNSTPGAGRCPGGTTLAGGGDGAPDSAAAMEPAVSHAPMTIMCTGTYWRNAWKYQARTYRHFGWDKGTLLANMLAMSTALDLPAKIICGFVDT